jgi:hypothetical protein
MTHAAPAAAKHARAPAPAVRLAPRPAHGRSCSQPQPSVPISRCRPPVPRGEQTSLLYEFDVPKAEQDEVLGLLALMREKIVDVESAKTGTPLPDTHRTAPALS